MARNIRIGRRTFYGVDRVGLNQSDQAGTVEFPHMVISEPVNVTLSKDGWNGSCYTLTKELYVKGNYGIQIGLPSDTSNTNAQNVIRAAITINNSYSNAGSSTKNPYVQMLLVAVEAPEEDIDIALFGLTPAAATVEETATASAEGE